MRRNCMTSRPARQLATAASTILALLALSATASAATFVVTTTSDVATGGCDAASCSLREAIQAANDSAADDMITIPAGTFTVSITGTDEDANVDGDLDIEAEATAGKLSIDGAGMTSTIIDATPMDERVLHTTGTVTFGLSDLTIMGGNVNSTAGVSAGGGVLLGGGGAATLDRVRITGNHSEGGGGGIDLEGGTLAISDSRVDTNVAGSSGGGILIAGAGALTADRIEVSGNSHDKITADGGGIFIQGNASGTINNSTIADNRATINGGGINVNVNGTATLTNTTIVGNTADSDFSGGVGGGMGGGYYIEGSGTVNLANTIFSGNTRQLTATTTTPDTCDDTDGGTVVATGRNLVDSTVGCTNASRWQATDIKDVPALLGPFGFNGGTTKNFSPMALSPAIDAGSSVVCAGSLVDQRGFVRAAATCDIGSVEGGYMADLGVMRSPMSAPVGTGTNKAVTFTVSNSGPDFAPGVTFSVPIPTGSRVMSKSSTGMTCTGTTTITCTRTTGGLDVGATATLMLTLRPTTLGTKSFIGNAVHTGTDPVAFNDVATFRLTGLQRAPRVTLVQAGTNVYVSRATRRFKVTARCPKYVATGICSARMTFTVRKARKAMSATRAVKTVAFACNGFRIPSGGSKVLTCTIPLAKHRGLTTGHHVATVRVVGGAGPTRTTITQALTLKI